MLDRFVYLLSRNTIVVFGLLIILGFDFHQTDGLW